MQSLLSRFLHNEGGATAIEYGLIAALIAVGCIAAISSFGGGLQALFQHVQDKAGNAMTDAAAG